MSSVVEVNKVSKKYTLYHQNQAAYTTLIETLTNQAKNIARRVRYPFNHSKSLTNNTSEEFWALKDVEFSINQGDRLGIIGRNGAGKSTLLKVLSRIAEPTSGSIKVKGRIACLLEVGTGFHPELTGRENIFLNGAILGMRRQEIKSKFDDIVAFSGVEKFLDTPMKRYSSGMQARLGFGVAAHLDAELLIIDEVLSVGDAQFQARCLKKMNSLGAEGRTILFVSHDVGSVLTLCNKGIYLEKGMLKEQGPIDQVINRYMGDCHKRSLSWEGNVGDENIRVYRASLIPADPTREYFYQHENPALVIDYEVLVSSPDIVIGVGVWSQQNHPIAYTHTGCDVENYLNYTKVGKHRITIPINGSLFHEGEYFLKLDCSLYRRKLIVTDEVALKYQVYESKKNTNFNHPLFNQCVSLGNQWQLTRSTI